MRNHPLPTIPGLDLIAVTGGCHKGPPPQMAAPQAAPDPGPRVSVSVATGAQGGAAIQQALGGGTGAAPAA